MIRALGFRRIMFVLVTICGSSHGAELTPMAELKIGQSQLQLQPVQSCKKNKNIGYNSLNEYLSQYDFALEWGPPHLSV